MILLEDFELLLLDLSLGLSWIFEYLKLPTLSSVVTIIYNLRLEVFSCIKLERAIYHLKLDIVSVVIRGLIHTSNAPDLC